MSLTDLEIVPLGGLGEFGMNMMVLACGDTAIVVDAGVMFPEADLPGVDLIIPDLTHLQKYAGRVKALVLTHGHEDHIGAVPYVLPHVDGPVYGTPLTLALLEPKLDSKARGRLVPVKPREAVTVGPFEIEFVRVTHSMPDCVALAIYTPVGTVVHTGDFKIDQTPLDGEHVDFHRLAELGARGVLALFGDSTNIDRPGYTGSELEVIDAFEEVFTATEGKIVVALFSSSLHRMQVLVNLAEQYGRKVAFVGRGVIENTQIASRLGHLKVPPGLQIRDSDVRNYPAQDVLCLCTGSQGEPLAALPRIAIDDHKHVDLGPGDVVVFSAREIPGNEKAIGRVMNHIARRGAAVVDGRSKRVHVSGHGSAEELKLMLSLVRPRYFVPIHGEYRQLARHAQHRRARLPVGDRAARGGRRRAPLRRVGRPHRRQGAGGAHPHRRHADRRGGRRGAARPAAPGGRRPGRAGAGHRAPVGRPRGAARPDHARVRRGRADGGALEGRARLARRRRRSARASRNGRTPG